MPATIPSHQALILPLKLISPRRFDGVALVVGSAMPDLAYVAQGLTVTIPSHAWHSLLWFSLPLTVFTTILVRGAAGTVATHLPAGGPLALRDYGVLSLVRHPAAVTAVSAVLGAAGHMLWDSFTHPYILAGHPFTPDGTYLPAMHRIAVAGLPWWRVIQLVSELIGTAAVISFAVHIGRRRLLVAWHGPAPRVPRHPALFWTVAAATGLSLTGLAAALPGVAIGAPNVLGMRVIAAVSLALLAAATACRLRTARDARRARARPDPQLG